MLNLASGAPSTTDSVVLNLDRESRAATSVATHLASGLRIATSADDPSGYTTSKRLSASVAGLDEGSGNLQTAGNVATVTSGALATVTTLVARMRTLSIKAASGLTSSQQLAQIQAEIAQLNAEIGTIAETTSFNGFYPFRQGTITPLITVVQGASASFPDALPNHSPLPNAMTLTLPSLPTPGNILLAELSYGNSKGGGGFPDVVITTPPGWTLVTHTDSPAENDGLVTYTHTVAAGDPKSYTFTATPGDNNTGTLLEIYGADPVTPIGPTATSNALSSVQTTPVLTTTLARQLPIAYFTLDTDSLGATTEPNWNEISSAPFSYHSTEAQVGPIDNAGVTLQDGYTWYVANHGNTTILLINPPIAPPESPQIIQATDNEGQIIPFTPPPMNQVILGTAEIDVTTTGTPSGAELAINICDNALAAVLDQQSQVGGFSNAAQAAFADNATASLNKAASQSAIADLDIAAAVTESTRDQLLTQLDTRLLSSLTIDRQSVLGLFKGA